MKNKILRDDRGFTLVELLIVLAISAIVMTLFVISYNVVNNANSQKAARRLEACIRSARMRSMSKGSAEGELFIYQQNGNVYATIGTGENATTEMICNAGVTIRCLANYTVYTGGDSVPEYPAGIKMVFNTSGSIRTYGGSTSYRKFILSRDSRQYQVIVYTETGAVETGILNTNVTVAGT